MKKVIAWLLAIALTAAISIGATLAYLTDTDEDVNVMTLGKVKIDQLEYERIDVESKNDDATVQEFHDNKPLIPAVTKDGLDYAKPGDTYVDWEQIGKDGYTSPIWNPELINNEVDKMVFVKNKGDYDAYVRSVFAFEAGKYTTLDQFKQMVHLNLNETDYEWEWLATPVTIGESTYFVATATYNKVLAPGALTEISLSQIALDSTATNEDVEAFGDTYQVLVKSQGIQADGFENAADALNEGFGVITDQNIPWQNDSPIAGIDLYTALHYVDGDTSTADITKKVSNITFGLTANHADVADYYDGTLVDVEQDVPVYAYYVPNGSNYHVYFLANDTIYTPTDCSNLCNGMSALTTVDTANLDVSRTTNMFRMFRDCTALKSIDVSDWDTSKVTNMQDLFRNCQVLSEVDVSGWDTGNVETMLAAFQDCRLMTTVDVSDWDTSKVTNMTQMFNRCYALNTLDVSNWDTSRVTMLYLTFANCEKLSSLDVSGWETGNVENMYGMFWNCRMLTGLDVSNWDTSKVTSMYLMFDNCEKLNGLDVSDWKTGKVENMYGMFAGCKSLEALDVSDWDTGKVTTIAAMFNHCEKVEVLDVSEWDVSKVSDFSMTFQACWALTSLDVSKWDTGSGTNMGWMFYGCGNLTELKLDNWNVSNVTVMSHMFADCVSLQTMPVDNWNVSKLQSMDATFNDCDALTTINVSKWNTGNVREFSQVFDGCDNLVEIVGLENWNTSNGRVFDEMFNACKSLKVLNLSSFNTQNVTPGFKNVNGDLCKGFSGTFSGMNSVEKLILGPNFRFAGNGQVAEQYQPKFPNPAPINGQATKWYNAANDTYYTAAEIPEPNGETVTYVAAVPPANP